MVRHLGDIEEAVPALAPGVTRLLGVDERSTAPHRLVLAHLQADAGSVLWVDARDTASTYALYALTRNRRLLDAIELARAWTAYQHHTLVRQLVERVTPRTSLVVLPNVCSLYRDDDLGDREADRLLGATLSTVAELANARELPALLTADRAERAILESFADHTYTWEQTRHGETFHGEDFQPPAYPGAGWWQTTVPYWVELLGATEQGIAAADSWTSPDPTQVALAVGP